MSGQGLSFITSDDVELIYDDEGVGRAFVFLHGYGCRRGHWEYQRKALLDADHRVIALDLRGHGDSQKPPHGQTIARMGQDVRELISALDLNQVTLVGHSMGVSVSHAMFMISGLDRIERFVHIDQSPKIINDEHWHWGVKGVNWSNVDDCVNFRIKWSNEDQEPPLPPGSAMAEEPWASFDHAAVSKLFLNHFVSDWRDVLPRITVPTWVVTSRFTNYYHPEGMQWVADQIPDSRFTIFEHSGHQPHVSEADEFNAQLLDFSYPHNA
ncbi:alpha/beta hydrolase [Rhodococcus opacus]|uniref:alpha/beta fold hydrolase n=1 Tax=Rhodococcus TaxID=1827 RepID=UPI00146E47CC|nr:alpha/beta hydrolase [Rhodococcus sp. IEGM 1351]MDI9935279.1 alpha/beta hydrolase [Rhodococcus sp. IEGM 1351]WKN57527.1 alpha/beta hydrolase [Rhodococcus opacus]